MLSNRPVWFRRVFFSGCCTVATPLVAAAQVCTPGWERFHAPGAGGEVFALAGFDDGSGTALYVGGQNLDPGIDSIVNGIARWRPTGWEVVPGVAAGYVGALATFDEGAGERLFVGGQFPAIGGVTASSIARFDGVQYTPVGTGWTSALRFVHALLVFADGGGEELWAAGRFLSLGGTPANNVGRWNGTTWSAAGAGLGVSDDVRALCVFDDGNGPRMCAGGTFATSGGTPISNVARWNGTAWEELGDGLDFPVFALAVHDAGSGPRLYAAGINRIARLDGSTWTTVGTADVGYPQALRSFTDASGSYLYASGSFTSIDSVPAQGLARFNGSTWSEFGAGLANQGGPSNIAGRALVEYDSGADARLFVGGRFTSAGNVAARSLASVRDGAWAAIAPPSSPGGPLNSMARARIGGVERLYVGGAFSAVGEIEARGIAAWDGVAWTPLGEGLGLAALALVAFDDGSGPGIVAGGFFTTAGGLPANRIARWNGNAWSPLGAGFDSGVTELVLHDSGQGPELYAAGYFQSSGGAPLSRIARWDGAAWQPLGTGINVPPSSSSPIACMRSFDDGSGPRLYVGGFFASAGGVPVANVAAWNGSSWSAVGGGFSHGVGGFPPWVFALEAHDDGSGSRLFAGGQFTRANGVITNGVARWTGSAWEPTAASGPGEVYALASFADDSGPGLAAASFVSYGRLGILRNGAWTEFGGGLSSAASVLSTFDDGRGGGERLFVGGSFTGAGGERSESLAAWRGCALDGASFCAGDGLDLAVTTPCPCGNFGAAGNGCANSVVAAGARLDVVGSTALDDVELLGSGMPANSPCIYLKGDASIPAGTHFGDGVRCVDGALVRLGTVFNVGGASRYPSGTLPRLSVRGGTPPGSGLTAHYQVYYRSATASFCPPAVFNVSNGWRLAW